MPADPTNMRDRIAESATQWALMYPLANWGFWGFVKGEARDQIAAVADDLAAAWGRDIADRVLAELFTATDPGGDLHRQTVEHLGQAWPDLTEDPVYLDQLAHEALSVRWGHAVRQAVEVKRLRSDLEAAREERDAGRLVSKGRTMEQYDTEAAIDKALDGITYKAVRPILVEAVMSAIGPELERLRKELAETKRERDANHDKALIASRIHNYGGQVSCDDVTMLLRDAEAERDALNVQVAVLQQALADRGDDVLAFQRACGTHLPEQAGKERAEAAKRLEYAQGRLRDADTVNRGLRRALETVEAERDALKADRRCLSCDHLVNGHQQDGCWYAVTTGTAGRDLVCPCTVPAADLDHPTAGAPDAG